MINIHRRINIVTGFLILLALTAVSADLMQSQQQTNFTVVPLNTITAVNQSAYTSSYYKSTVANPSSNQILLITVSSDIQTYIDIFVSTSDSPDFKSGTWPSWESYNQQCFYSSIDTCALKLPDVSSLPNGQTDLVIYFTVSVTTDCSYNLQVSLETVYPVKVGHKYSVTFDRVQAAMLQLPGSSFMTASGEQVQQIVITCTYVSYKNIGHFQVLAQQGEFPSSSSYKVVRSKSLTSMTQILQLNPVESANSSYFILLQGQNNTKFNISIQPIVSLVNPDLKINQTISYLTKQPLNYSYHAVVNTSVNATVRPLYIELYALRGYGKFYVDYCNGLYNFSFQNVGGENAQVQISFNMRYECFQKISMEGGLLIQNLVVGVAQIGYEFGYSIGLYEEVFLPFLYPGLKQIGVIKQTQIFDYEVAAYGQTVNLTLTAQALVGSVNITIYQCQVINQTKKTTCKFLKYMVISQGSNVLGKLTFWCEIKHFCQINVTRPQNTSNNYSKYSLLVSYVNQQSRQLLPNIPQFDMIQMKQYIHYFINVTALKNNPDYKLGNSTAINIRNTIVNGQTVMLSSLKVEQPVFSDFLKDNSDVQYGYEGSITYYFNQSTYPEYIYVAVLGGAESIYHIQFTVNTSANIPSAYLDMIEDVRNDYVISANNPYVLLKYVGHISPYTINFDPVPSCIKYGNKLPLENTCVSPSSMPTQFHGNVVYFNISQNLATPGAVYKFSAYVNSGSYLLIEDRPILIGCESQCYEIINVIINKPSATIIHNGAGKIVQLPNTTNNQASNGPLVIECASSPCKVQLNATMIYGGEMQVAFQASIASEIDWRTKPMLLPDQNKYNLFFMKIPKYYEYNSLIFYAQAADLTVYYNILALNQSYTNILNYTYPNQTSHMGVSYGDPLQEIHVVDLDNELIEANKCKERNIICILTLAVTLNSSIEYSEQYLSNGLGFYSANVYHYEISEAWPVLGLKQQYSLSYFTHTIDFSKDLTSFPYTIHIQSLSNCRPQIQTQSTGYLHNFYTDVRLPRIMPGQQTINYRVLSNQICMFSTTLTSVPYQLYFANIQYNIKVDKDNLQTIIVYQHNKYDTGFTVYVKENVASIIVGNVTESFDKQGLPTIVIPTIQNKNNLAYVQNSSSLKMQGTDTDNIEYIIVINFFYNPLVKSSLIPIMIKTQYDPILLLHNQEQSYTYDPTDNSISANNNSTIVYEYHSTNNFYIFAKVNKLQVRITVRDAEIFDQNQFINRVVIDNISDPWVFVNSSNSSSTLKVMTNYRIECQFVGTLEPGHKATFSIHIQEEGVNGLTQIYPGISIYDAFTHDRAMNCYKFVTPMMLGQDTVTVDLNFISAENLPNQNSTIVYGSANLAQKQIQKLSIKQSKIAPTTYRLTFDFLFSSTYKVCFILDSVDMIGEEYSLIVNVPSMPMLYDNQYIKLSTVYNDEYEMFEYIFNGYNPYGLYEYAGKPVSFTVTSCFTQPATILASSSYNQMQTGKMTEIGSYWTKNGITTAIIDVPHGYYYLGVKAVNSSIPQLFRANIQKAPIFQGKPTMLQSSYFINWNIKSKIYTTIKNNIQFVVIQVPSIFKIKSAPNAPNPQKIVYSLYLLNLINAQNKKISYSYSIDNYARCPSLYRSNNPNETIMNPTSVIVVKDPLNAKVFQQTVTFSIDIKDFIEQSNFSIKAEVYVTDQENQTTVLEYFYGHAEIRIGSEGGTDGPWSIFRWIFLISILFACIGGASVFVKFYLRRRGRNISFEMAQYPMPRESQSRRQPQQPQNPPVDITNTSASSNRRPLNANQGYGQFVDQVV